MDRRRFLLRSGGSLLGLALGASAGAERARGEALAASGAGTNAPAPRRGGPLTLFLAGDVMTGRGIDQVLPRSVDPRLHEEAVTDARTYVELAEAANGPIPRRVPPRYVWGDALEELARVRPGARIVNLETAVTTSGDWARGKAVLYRMHPGNVGVLTAAGIDVCGLGNNHVLDWGRAGLRETLATLRGAGIRTAGAGVGREAAAPAVVETAAGRVLVFAYGTPSAGVPAEWEPAGGEPGVNLLPQLDAAGAERVIGEVGTHRRPGDRVVVSIHWGGNWGYAVPPEQREFAHRLIDAGAADVVHGHSSHHAKGVEVYRGRPILYGAGDFLNDYEGISGYEAFRGDLTLMYFPTLDASGALASFEMAPMRIRRFRLQRASGEEARWLRDTLDRESRQFGTRVELTGAGRLAVRWG